MTAITTVSTSFASVTVSGSLFVRRGRKAYYTVSGTFAQTLELQRRVSLQAWEPVTRFTSTVALQMIVPRDSDETYRLACIARTSGTAVTTLYDEAATIHEFKDLTGKVVGSVDELGVFAFIAQPTNSATAPPTTAADVGAVAGSGNTVAEYGDGVVHKTVITLASLSVTMTDAGAAGCHGSQKVYDFPAGVIQVLGCSYNLTTLAGAGGIADGAALVGSLGTVAAGVDNATLTATEADLIASTTGTLTAGAGALASHASLVATAFDGHTTAIDAFLNLAVPDADSSATDTVAVSGTITVTWVNLGDY